MYKLKAICPPDTTNKFQSQLIVVISLFFWAWVLGPIGALLVVPMTIIVKEIFLEGFDDTRGLAVLLGSRG